MLDDISSDGDGHDEAGGGRGNLASSSRKACLEWVHTSELLLLCFGSEGDLWHRIVGIKMRGRRRWGRGEVEEAEGRKQASVLCGQRLGGGGSTSKSLHLLDRGFQSCKTDGEMQGGGKEWTPQSKQAFTIQVEAAESLAACSGVSRFGH